MHSKLSRNVPGLANPISLFIPWQVQRHLNALCTGYGADIKVVCKKKNKDVIYIFIDKEIQAISLFHPQRFNGTNYLAKRRFHTVLNNETKKQEWKCTGIGKVVVSNYTPIKLEYDYSKQTLTVLFYIQRYDENNFALDATVQAMLNQC